MIRQAHVAFPVPAQHAVHSEAPVHRRRRQVVVRSGQGAEPRHHLTMSVTGPSSVMVVGHGPADIASFLVGQLADGTYHWAVLAVSN